MDIASAQYQQAGKFRIPFYPNLTGSCNAPGFSATSQLYEWVGTANGSVVNKYHLGEDWNGKCGGSTDKGAPVYTVAEGVVIDYDNVGTKDSYGKSIKIRHTLTDGTRLDVVYMHLEAILTNNVVKGNLLGSGVQIGTLGDANGFYAGAAHLHFEGRTSDFPIRTNPYANPLTPAKALTYLPMSLIIDDRANLKSTSLNARQWNFFSVSTYVPSSTAFVALTNNRYSINRAISSGLLHNKIYYWSGTTWVALLDNSKIIFQPGVVYAVWPYAAVTWNLLIPGNTRLADRAKRDMVRAMASAGVTSIEMKSYVENPSWWTDPNYELRYIPVTVGAGAGIMYHAMHRNIRLLRFTTLCQQSCPAWSQVDPNRLH
ncbi:MAG: M23 family metallopeptidase [Propylenella sp.]